MYIYVFFYLCIFIFWKAEIIASMCVPKLCINIFGCLKPKIFLLLKQIYFQVSDNSLISVNPNIPT